MPVESLDELMAALERGDEQAIVGTPEGSWVEFKSAPYLLKDNDDQRLELAKDIAALANHGGGVIVLGVRTRKMPALSQDVADALTRIDQSMVTIEAYRGTIEQWTYPPIRNLQVNWWLEVNGKGICTIRVPAAADAERPVLVQRVSVEEGRRRLLLGIFERAGDQAVAYQLPEVHRWIQLGRMAERIGLQFAGATAAPEGVSSKHRARRLTEDARALGLIYPDGMGGTASLPRFWIQAWPDGQVEVQGMFGEEAQSLHEAFAFPATVRRMGFWIHALAPELMAGGALRVAALGRSLSLERNGLLTFVGAIDKECLTYHAPAGRPDAINSLVLIESTLEFVRWFVRQVLPRCPPTPRRWCVAAGMDDVLQGGRPAYLAPYAPGYQQDRDWKPAQRDQFRVGPFQFEADLPPVVAFRLLQEIYLEFGIDPSGMPYSGRGAVSEAAINEAG